MSFALLIGLGAVLVHLYLYRRLVRRVVPAGRGRRLALAVLVAMALLLVLRATFRGMGGVVAVAYPIVAYGWMAIAVCMAVAVLVGDLIHLGVLAYGQLRPAAQEVDAGRRAFLTETLPRGVAVGGAAMAGWGTLRAFTPAEITETAVRVAKLPSALDGLSIVQLTDIHVGPFIRTRFIDALVAQANALRPDIVVITGDLVDGSVAQLGDAAAGLGRLQARYGTWFVTGNHDYYSGDVAWCEFLERLGIGVLRNRSVAIGDGGGSIDLIGVDDWSGAQRRAGSRGYDLERALADRDAERAAVLLAHQPRGFADAVARGVDLQISGHTHGGQLFPMTAAVGLAWDYSRGLYEREGSHIYVSRGCGFWGPPARVGSAPEIAKLVLTV